MIISTSESDHIDIKEQLKCLEEIEPIVEKFNILEPKFQEIKNKYLEL